MTVRFYGAGLLGLSLYALYRLHGLVTTPPHHPPSVAELILSLVVVLAGLAGALATMIGPDLFRAHPWPPRGRPDGE